MFEEESNRFVLKEAGNVVAEITWETLDNNILDVNHTFVDPSQRGKGLAEKLVLEVLAKAKKEKAKIIPSCSYVAKYFETHQEYAELLASR